MLMHYRRQKCTKDRDVMTSSDMMFFVSLFLVTSSTSPTPLPPLDTSYYFRIYFIFLYVEIQADLPDYALILPGLRCWNEPFWRQDGPRQAARRPRLLHYHSPKKMFFMILAFHRNPIYLPPSCHKNESTTTTTASSLLPCAIYLL